MLLDSSSGDANGEFTWIGDNGEAGGVCKGVGRLGRTLRSTTSLSLFEGGLSVLSNVRGEGERDAGYT